jgi:hypothetical protein
MFRDIGRSSVRPIFAQNCKVSLQTENLTSVSWQKRSIQATQNVASNWPLHKWMRFCDVNPTRVCRKFGRHFHVPRASESKLNWPKRIEYESLHRRIWSQQGPVSGCYRSAACLTRRHACLTYSRTFCRIFVASIPTSGILWVKMDGQTFLTE